MFEALFNGFLALFQPNVLLMWLIGTLIGLIVGVIPVVGPLEISVLLLPFIFKMDPAMAFALLVSIGAVSTMGGSMTSILVNIPGDAPNAATLLDGYPISRKGHPGRAIGAALMANGLGGIASVLFALLMIPLVIPLIMHIWSAEMFFLVIMGLAFLAMMSQGGKIKGLAVGGLGILLAFVGMQSATGIPRFTFGVVQLFDGINLIPVLLGIFGLSEIIDLVASGQSIAPKKAAMGGFKEITEGMKDVFRNMWLWVRCVIIGYFIGVLPGIGRMSSTFIAYAHAKQTSKHPEKFGTGIIEGVIAPEAGNTSSNGGELLTTLALGIPGSAGMTIILAAFLMLGIVPGPGMLLDHLQLSFTMLLTIVVSILVAAIVCLMSAKYLMRLVNINPKYLFCAMTPIIFIGSFIMGETMVNVLMVIIFGVLGFFMKRFGYPRPALALGFILGSLFEYYFWTSLQFEGPLFFVRPISLVLIAVTIGVLSYDYIKSLFKSRSKGVDKA